MTDAQHVLIVNQDGELVPPAPDDIELPADPDPQPELAEAQHAEAQALIPYEQHAPLRPGALSLDEIGKIGRVFAQSGIFKDTRDAAQAIVKILAGQELGIGPFQAMSQIHLIEGKAALGAGIVGALVKRSNRYDFRVQEASDEKCVLEWLQDGEVVGTSSFSMADAQRAGLKDKQNWKRYPSDMMLARALTRGARRFCPDVFGGAVYVAEELGGAGERG